jgi:RNA polymerase sigma factor (sigma-70 family)
MKESSDHEYQQPYERFTLASSQRFFEDKSDLEIWKMFKQGHEGAFNYIYKAYFQELFRYGYRFTQEREIIKDAIHDMFVELRMSCQRLADTNSIRFYLYKVLRNKLTSTLAKRHLRLFREPISGDFDVEFSYETKLIQQQISQEQYQQLNQGLRKLTPREKEALFYFYYQGMSYEEVAGVMELSSVKSARNLIYKALRTLRGEVALPTWNWLALFCTMLTLPV